MTGLGRIGLAALAVVLPAACGGTSAQSPSGADGAAGQGGNPDAGAEAATPGGYSLPDFPGGNDFFLSLPPTFSPFLPLSGDEATREPPGFHDPASDYYFSYEFIWWLTGTPDLSTAGLRADLHDYFIGLCGSTTAAVTLGDPPGGTADAGVLVARREGTLDAGSCFNSPVPLATIEASTYACPDHTAVIVLVSPQPAASQVWTDLRAIRDQFTCF
jgi:hypothetical protein